MAFSLIAQKASKGRLEHLMTLPFEPTPDQRKQVEAMQKEREGVVKQATRAGMKKADIAAALREEARQ